MMPDKITKKQRSYIMSRIMSKWTKQERLAHSWLKGCKIRHKMHPRLNGSPDILLADSKTVIFIDGCFWHGCKSCFKKPKSNVAYWEKKISGNKARDKKISGQMRSRGYKVVRIWEHEIKKGKNAFFRKMRH